MHPIWPNDLGWKIQENLEKVTCVAGANQLQAFNSAKIQKNNEEKENQKQVVLSPASDGRYWNSSGSRKYK